MTRRRAQARPGSITLHTHAEACPGTGPDWLPLAAAAEALGVSVDTARRRVRRGELDAVRVPGSHGVAWYVRLPAEARIGVSMREHDAQARPGLPTVIEASIEPTVQALLAYLRERDQQRDREVADLRAELADVRAELGTRNRELGAALERIRALGAPREPTMPRDALQRPTDGLAVETAQGRPRRNGRGGASGKRETATWLIPRATLVGTPARSQEASRAGVDAEGGGSPHHQRQPYRAHWRCADTSRLAARLSGYDGRP